MKLISTAKNKIKAIFVESKNQIKDEKQNQGEKQLWKSDFNPKMI